MPLILSDKIWMEDELEENGRMYIQLHDSISEEERRRFVDMDLINQVGEMEGKIPQTYIRPRQHE